MNNPLKIITRNTGFCVGERFAKKIIAPCYTTQITLSLEQNYLERIKSTD
jgi:hypothetical protein